MEPNWTDVASAIANISIAIFTAIGFPFIVMQIRRARRTLEITTFEHLYSRMHDIHKIFVEKPHLRAYFYDAEIIDSSSKNYLEVCAAAEMFADFFQQIYLQIDLMPSKAAEGWKTYMENIVSNSPVLKEHLKCNKAWYTSALDPIMRKYC